METKFPYLEFGYPGLKDVSERKGRRFIKTHLPYHLLPERIQSSKTKVGYFGIYSYFLPTCGLLLAFAF